MYSSSGDKSPNPIEVSILAARGGSFSAVGQLLDLYRPYMLHLASDEIPTDLVPKLSPSDLVQETCLQAARDFPNFDGCSEEELRGWLRQILVRNLQDMKRHFLGTQKRAAAREIRLTGVDPDSHQPANLVCPQPSPFEMAVSAETRQALERAMKLMPEEYRRVVELRSIELLPFEQIGQEMDRSADAARKLWARAIEWLNEQMKSDASSH